jgi:hypothetical protein
MRGGRSIGLIRATSNLAGLRAHLARPKSLTLRTESLQRGERAISAISASLARFSTSPLNPQRLSKAQLCLPTGGGKGCSLRNSGSTRTMEQLTHTRTAAGTRSMRDAMKTILSALVALSVIASVAGPANALDAKTFFEQVDRDHN